MSAFDPLRTLAKFLAAPPHIMTCGVQPSEDTSRQLATAAALAIQVPVRQPRQEAVNRNGRDHAQPAAEIEEWRHGEREQEEREIVSVHGASRDSTRCRDFLQQPFDPPQSVVTFNGEMEGLTFQLLMLGVQESDDRSWFAEVAPRASKYIALPPRLFRRES